MSGIKIVRKEQVEKWEHVENDYNIKCEENRKLKICLKDGQKLISTLKSKLQGTKAVIFDIKKDKMENDSYVFVQDNRKPFYTDDTKEIYPKGSVNLFVLSAVMCPSNISGRFVDMPYLKASFGKTNVVIDELHSDMNGGKYENMGYATMMIEALITVAKKSKCTSITGKLSSVDAKTEERKEKRNCFYINRGFEISFENDLREMGNICLHI